MENLERGKTLEINCKKEILVVCDCSTEMNDHMAQIISKARTLADGSSYTVCVLYVGEKKESTIKKILKCGTDLLLYGITCKNVGMWQYSDIITDIVKARKPQLILFQATNFGKDIAAIISTRFEAGLTADCIEILYDSKKGFLFVRAAICDSVVAQISCINCDINMATVKEGVFKISTTDRKTDMQILDFAVQDCENKYGKNEVCLEVQQIEQIENEININEYATVFCIGRGASSPECIKAIYLLAEKYNACVVGTRPIIEDGLMDKARQVGQSGKSISPQLYVGFGVSGASQHLVGIRNAKKIIAINSDPKAPIFEYADYSIMTDVKEILDELLKLCTCIGAYAP